MTIASSELILNKDGSVYHLNLLPNDVAETIITVGDPGRVSQVSKYFDNIEIKKQKREFVCHTGTIGKKRLSVISTGIGTDNIDIVFNEIDALFNINLNTRTIKSELTSLEFFRIGTSGCIQSEIPIDSFLVSETAIGMDNLNCFYGIPDGYNDVVLDNILFTEFGTKLPLYTIKVRPEILERFISNEDFVAGNTLTATGFYGPQGRKLRTNNNLGDFVETFSQIEWEGKKITNIEMETSAMYLFAANLGHSAISLNALIANRKLGKFSVDPKKTVELLIQKSLELITNG